MVNQKNLNESDILASTVVEGMMNIKAKEIISLNLTDIDTAVCDYFIICHGTSDTHVSAISESIIEETLNTLKEKPWHREGLTNNDWVLLDYGNVVAHVFQKDTREYYNIEKLWGDAKIQLYKESA
ncbi:MAG: ribosome silencing factor [Flavobacteriales bacterium]